MATVGAFRGFKKNSLLCSQVVWGVGLVPFNFTYLYFVWVLGFPNWIKAVGKRRRLREILLAGGKGQGLFLCMWVNFFT